MLFDAAASASQATEAEIATTTCGITSVVKTEAETTTTTSTATLTTTSNAGRRTDYDEHEDDCYDTDEGCR